MGLTTEHKQRDDGELVAPAQGVSENTSEHALTSSDVTANLSAYSKAGDVYFFASDHEADYPDTAKKIKVNGGTFVGIAGGLEHNFAYWVASQPDKIVLYDVNSWAIKLAKAKCELILACDSYQEFSQRFDKIFKGKEQFTFTSISPDDASELILAGIRTARTAIFLSPRCERENGWDKPEQFGALKRLISANTIEFVHGDMLAEDFTHQEDVSLIFVSDIFGIGANEERKPQLLDSLKNRLADGKIRETAQVIDADHPQKVAGVKNYIN